MNQPATPPQDAHPVEGSKPLAVQYYEAHHKESGLEEKLIDTILKILGIEPDNVDTWPCSDFTFDWYDTSFELKGCKPDSFDITEQQGKEFAALGFSRCWLCFGERNEPAYKEKYHGF